MKNLRIICALLLFTFLICPKIKAEDTYSYSADQLYKCLADETGRSPCYPWLQNHNEVPYTHSFRVDHYERDPSPIELPKLTRLRKWFAAFHEKESTASRRMARRYYKNLRDSAIRAGCRCADVGITTAGGIAGFCGTIGYSVYNFIDNRFSGNNSADDIFEDVAMMTAGPFFGAAVGLYQGGRLGDEFVSRHGPESRFPMSLIDEHDHSIIHPPRLQKLTFFINPTYFSELNLAYSYQDEFLIFKKFLKEMVRKEGAITLEFRKRSGYYFLLRLNESQLQ